MMPSRLDVVTEAREWVGTPHVHQGNIKGVGVDCDNFIALVAINSKAIAPLDYPNDYRRREDGTIMEEIMRSVLGYVPSLEVATLADVIAFHDGKIKTRMRHLATISQLEPYIKVVHSSERGVREHRLDAYLKSLIHSIWRLPNLSDG